ncbi:MAG: hypothetical protein PF690_06740 [Deltaproteobacteria bacterium]|jgi:hypothetical protein|nr:hypothetical protein [Deltaproteobacteria bacterium]
MEIINDFEATISFKHDILWYAQENWKEAATKINKMFKIDPPLSTDNYATFNYFISILFIQSRAPYNLYGQKQGDRIWQYLKNSFLAEEQYGEHAINSLELCLEGWNHHSAKKNNPLGAIASVLLFRLNYKEKDTDTILGQLLGDILGLSPPWWKNFSKKKKLTKSDIPVDSKNFNIFFKGMNQNNENIVNDYDLNGLTLLMRAVQIGDVGLVKNFLSKGADPLKIDGKSGTTSAIGLVLQKLSTVENEEKRERYNLILNLFKDHCEKK